jgi:L-alanine-DL-glutamate epimerase-like enolase superfamily enzyme
MKITDVEAIYLRLPQVKEQCDSGQDALIVKVHTDAGITGIGEVDSNPMAVKGAIEGPFSSSAKIPSRPKRSGTRCTAATSMAGAAAWACTP